MFFAVKAGKHRNVSLHWQGCAAILCNRYANAPWWQASRETHSCLLPEGYVKRFPCIRLVTFLQEAFDLFATLCPLSPRPQFLQHILYFLPSPPLFTNKPQCSPLTRIWNVKLLRGRSAAASASAAERRRSAAPFDFPSSELPLQSRPLWGIHYKMRMRGEWVKS